MSTHKFTYEEVEVPPQVLNDLADGWSVRYFKVPSESNPKEFYYVQAVKETKAGWSNGSAIFLCNCKSAQFKQCLAIVGVTKATCKHSEDLRAALGTSTN